MGGYFKEITDRQWQVVLYACHELLQDCSVNILFYNVTSKILLGKGEINQFTVINDSTVAEPECNSTSSSVPPTASVSEPGGSRTTQRRPNVTNLELHPQQCQFASHVVEVENTTLYFPGIEVIPDTGQSCTVVLSDAFSLNDLGLPERHRGCGVGGYFKEITDTQWHVVLYACHELLQDCLVNILFYNATSRIVSFKDEINQFTVVDSSTEPQNTDCNSASSMPLSTSASQPGSQGQTNDDLSTTGYPESGTLKQVTNVVVILVAVVLSCSV